MSLSDPIGDMIARVKNAQARNHKKVELPSSNFKSKIADILKNEGFIKDFKITDENKMYFDQEERAYKANILLKQGFYNYTFATKETNGNINTNDVNGSFYETENEYTVIVYYKPFGSFFERVVGIGTGFFDQNR